MVEYIYRKTAESDFVDHGVFGESIDCRIVECADEPRGSRRKKL